MGQPDAQTFVFSGLGTLSYTVGVVGYYSVESKSDIPTATSGQGPCGLVTTINKNGSPVTGGTSSAGSSGSSVRGVSCVVGDVLTVVYTSALGADAYPYINRIKSNVVIYQGE